MNNIIISNSCVGQFIMKNKNILPYNNPFIGSLIPNDDYLKLVNNFNSYINAPVKLGEPKKDSLFTIQSKKNYYNHRLVKIPYPVIYFGDIEIHFIHENDEIECLSKFNRRLERMKEIINNQKYKIIFTMSFSEFFNNHSNIQLKIDEYFSNNLNNSLIIEKYFIGPPEYNNGNTNYINIDNWKNIKLTRNSSHVYNFNDQIFSIDIFLNNIRL